MKYMILITLFFESHTIVLHRLSYHSNIITNVLLFQLCPTISKMSIKRYILALDLSSGKYPDGAEKKV